MDQVALSRVVFKDPSDIVSAVNGLPLPAQTQAASLPALMPGFFFWGTSTFGDLRICVARVDGQPMSISALDQSNVPYTPAVENYSILFPIGVKTHPDRRPS